MLSEFQSGTTTHKSERSSAKKGKEGTGLMGSKNTGRTSKLEDEQDPSTYHTVHRDSIWRGKNYLTLVNIPKTDVHFCIYNVYTHGFHHITYMEALEFNAGSNWLSSEVSLCKNTSTGLPLLCKQLPKSQIIFFPSAKSEPVMRYNDSKH